MRTRNGITGPATNTQLISGSTNSTEVVAQLYNSGAEAFSQVTIVNGGHNWPTPNTRSNGPVATHFNATSAIVDFWQNYAGLPS